MVEDFHGKKDYLAQFMIKYLILKELNMVLFLI